ncbi:MAG: hypothetical protein JW880_00595 [Candidatus Thermoplasmatota archaeon]|nr:hypothetical protein [Candidatus Thermoplasmatota archaeon]
MRLLLELSMECESLARAEAVSAMCALGDKPQVLGEDEGVLIVLTEADPRALASRLALCHHISEWMASCAPSELNTRAEDIDVPGPIGVRATKVGDRAVDLAHAAKVVGGVVGRSRGVDLRRPASEVRLVFSEKVHIGRLLASIDRASFEKRKNRYMPFVYPASIHPKFARAAVNLTEVRLGGRLLDPFSGTGAILIESALAGCQTIGSDLSGRMIEGASMNLAHSGVSAELHECDVGEILSVIGKVEGIATDLPYGRSTSTGGEGLAVLYERAFRAFGEVLDAGERLVVVLPALRPVESGGLFRVVDSHKLWVHRSLTRHFSILEKL